MRGSSGSDPRVGPVDHLLLVPNARYFTVAVQHARSARSRPPWLREAIKISAADFSLSIPSNTTPSFHTEQQAHHLHGLDEDPGGTLEPSHPPFAPDAFSFVRLDPLLGILSRRECFRGDGLVFFGSFNHSYCSLVLS